MALCGFHRKIRIVISDPENNTNNVHQTSGFLKSFSRIFREFPIFEYKLINSSDKFTALTTSSIFSTS
jgi:hypothetical protein